MKKEIILVIILIGIATIRFFFFLPSPNTRYDLAVGEKVVFDGVVNDFPDLRIYNQRLMVQPLSKDFNVLITTDIYTEFNYGDEISVVGILDKPENFITDAGKEFNYQRYLANQNVYYLIKNPEIEVISTGNGSFIKRYLFKLKKSFMENINRTIYFPENNLMNGILLGTRGGFDQQQNNEFINTGTIHIIALSGYNVTIVAEGIMKIFSLIFSRGLAISFGIFGIILFVILAGAQATAVRAGIMALIALFARMTGRNYDAGRALIFAGLFMIAYDPRVVTDISFQLSFIATVGVIFLSPKVERWFYFLTNKLKIRDLVSVTVSANIIVLPLILYSTGVFSVISLPANILILPLIPVSMFFGFVSGMIAFISPILAFPFGIIGSLLLKYILEVIHFFASLSFASFVVPNFSIIFTLIAYIFLAWWIFKKEK